MKIIVIDCELHMHRVRVFFVCFFCFFSHYFFRAIYIINKINKNTHSKTNNSYCSERSVFYQFYTGITVWHRAATCYTKNSKILKYVAIHALHFHVLQVHAFLLGPSFLAIYREEMWTAGFSYRPRDRPAVVSIKLLSCEMVAQDRDT